VEDKAVALCRQSPDEAARYLNAYSVEKADQMMDRWRRLAVYLIVKYNDMAVRPEKDGRFLMTPEGLPARVRRPGFPKNYAREMLRQTGDKYALPGQ